MSRASQWRRTAAPSSSGGLTTACRRGQGLLPALFPRPDPVGDRQLVSNPVVGIANNGNAVFGWLRREGTVDRVQVRGRTAGGALGPIQSVSSPAAKVVVGHSTCRRCDRRRPDGLDKSRQQPNPRPGPIAQFGRHTRAVKNLSLVGGQPATSPRSQCRTTATRSWRGVSYHVIQARRHSAAGVLARSRPFLGGFNLPQVAFDENGVAVFRLARPPFQHPGAFPLRRRRVQRDPERYPGRPGSGFPQVAMDNGIATAVWHRDDSSGNARIQTARAVTDPSHVEPGEVL